MSIDSKTLTKLTRLSQIEFNEEKGAAISKDLGNILDFISQLSEVNTENVEPMTSTVSVTSTPERKDEVKDFNRRAELLAVTPKEEMGFIVVPRVIE